MRAVYMTKDIPFFSTVVDCIKFWTDFFFSRRSFLFVAQGLGERAFRGFIATQQTKGLPLQSRVESCLRLKIKLFYILPQKLFIQHFYLFFR